MTYSIKRSQVIRPFGVGSLIEVGGESFVVKDTHAWRVADLERIQLPRLGRRIGHKKLLSPKEDLFSLPAMRFPLWLFCPNCRAMTLYPRSKALHPVKDPKKANQAPKCSNASCKERDLSPMRFVGVCDRGHLEDVDWYWWAHRRAQPAATGQCQRPGKMKFVVTGRRGGDFDSMRIECTCGAGDSLQGIADRPLPQKCSGRQPWQPADEAEACDERPWAEPRGSSTIQFGETASALFLPDSASSSGGSKVDALRSDPVYQAALRSLKDFGDAALPIVQAQVRSAAEVHGLTAQEADAIFELDRTPGGDREAAAEPAAAPSERDLAILQEEYALFVDPTDVGSPDFQQTTTILAAGAPGGMDKYLSRIVQVRRLKEARAFIGFSRRGDRGNRRMLPPDLGKGADWVPAVAAYGEGVFIELREGKLREWLAENREPIDASTRGQLDGFGDSLLASFLPGGADAQLILLHTLAHLLIRQLAQDCGYSSSSLRERIFSSEGQGGMSGILIYTTEGGTEGSLGGLVEMGEAERFSRVLVRAIERSQWCSSDPVCRELDGQGSMGLNRAACHCCALVSETSCTHQNSLLNRLLLTGRGGAEPVGFFSGLI